MRRGDIVTLAATTVFGTKPRPGLILQSDYFTALRTISLLGFTSQIDDALDLRLAVEPSVINGLRITSYAMIDSLTTVRRDDVGLVIGHIDQPDLDRIERAVLIFLGFHG